MAIPIIAAVLPNGKHKSECTACRSFRTKSLLRTVRAIIFDVIGQKWIYLALSVLMNEFNVICWVSVFLIYTTVMKGV